jgi:hypothetical protein
MGLSQPLPFHWSASTERKYWCISCACAVEAVSQFQKAGSAHRQWGADFQQAMKK